MSISIPFEKPFFNSFLVKKENNNLIFHDFGGYETRNESTIKLIKMCDDKFNLKDFDWVLVNTDDRDHCTEYHGVRTLSYCTSTDNYDNVCPDFLFDHWSQCGIDDYQNVCLETSLNGDKHPETNLLGWVGAGNGVIHSRMCLVNKSDGINIDAKFMQWSRRQEEQHFEKDYKLVSPDYISIPEHPKKWRYLIDVEGAGWSARLKLLMFSKRVVFLTERPYKEWFFPYMKPWENYVPVNRDCSNLVENLNIIKNDIELEKKISKGGYEFAQKYLSRDSAINRWKEILNN